MLGEVPHQREDADAVSHGDPVLAAGAGQAIADAIGSALQVGLVEIELHDAARIAVLLP
jgi:hypothetical protein